MLLLNACVLLFLIFPSLKLMPVGHSWEGSTIRFKGTQMPAKMALASSISSKAAPPHSGKVSAAGVEVHQSKMDFFCKLGYGKQDICKVLKNLGQEALEDDVLKELIRMGSKPQALENQAQPSQLKLVARGSCSTTHGGASGLKWLGEDGSDSSDSLRPIVIDGSNVAMSHGNKEVFSCWGIQLAVDWFRERGHTYIKVFVPLWRKEPPRQDSPIADQHILEELEKQSVLVYTPSRKVKGKRVVCYDDRYIVKVAYEKDGVIVSNDHYRDLQNENPEWKWFIEQRLLMYSFVSNRFMPPDDPLGRHGPTLSNFLSKKPVLPEKKWQPCPYGKKCTYGNKCKFYHPERQHQAQLSVADELRAKTKVPLSPGKEGERCQCSYTARAEPAPRDAGTETLREGSGCSGPCCYPGPSRGSCSEQTFRAWAGSPGCELGLEPLLEGMAAVSIRDGAYGWSLCSSGDRAGMDSPHRRAELRHRLLSLRHPRGSDRTRCPCQHGALPAAPGGMCPGHGWAQERGAAPGSRSVPGCARHTQPPELHGTAPGSRSMPGCAGHTQPLELHGTAQGSRSMPGCAGHTQPPELHGTAPGSHSMPGCAGHTQPPELHGTAQGSHSMPGCAGHTQPPELHGTAQGSRSVPGGARHTKPPEPRHPALLQPAALAPDRLPLYREQQLQQRCLHSQPPGQRFQPDPSHGTGLFQKTHPYPSASYRDYWPSPAARPPSAQQINIHRELSSPCPYSVMSQIMTLYPSIQDKGTGAPPL